MAVVVMVVVVMGRASGSRYDGDVVDVCRDEGGGFVVDWYGTGIGSQNSGNSGGSWCWTKVMVRKSSLL